VIASWHVSGRQRCEVCPVPRAVPEARLQRREQLWTLIRKVSAQVSCQGSQARLFAGLRSGEGVLSARGAPFRDPLSPGDPDPARASARHAEDLPAPARAAVREGRYHGRARVAPGGRDVAEGYNPSWRTRTSFRRWLTGEPGGAPRRSRLLGCLGGPACCWPAAAGSGAG
jgi:hypothetical protein